MMILHRNSTNVLRVRNYTDDVTGLPVTNATITATLYTKAGIPVSGATNLPLPFYVASGSIPAEYRGIVPSTVSLPDPKYGVRFVATNADGVREFTDTCIVEDG